MIVEGRSTALFFCLSVICQWRLLYLNQVRLMRRQKSFLLTIFPSESPRSEFCGQVKSVSTGKAYKFSNLDEFQKLINDMVSAENQAVIRQDDAVAIEPI
jgi:hypothetical protein